MLTVSGEPGNFATSLAVDNFSNEGYRKKGM
jgi:hypothetical protein